MTNPEESSRQLNAIVLDDDPLARRLAAASLRVIGVQPRIEAADGVEALGQLRAHGTGIDLALCDLEMEGMDGVEFLSQLHAEHAQIAVILVSGAERAVIESVEGMAKNLGLKVLGSLSKPLDRDKLAGLVARFSVVCGLPDDHPPFEGQISVSDLNAAIESMSFVPYFQPRVLLDNGELIGCESLVRWRHPRLGLIPPHRFLPLVRDAGQSIAITWRMLEQTFRELQGWRQAGLELNVSINISTEFLEEIAVTENVVALAQNYQIPFSRIILEIAEKNAVSFDGSIIGNLARLRLRGVRIAIDDFGTGYASMEQLSRVPFTELSIDRSFIAGAVRNPSIRAILESSLHLGRRLGLHTIAEGVESPDELAMLRQLPCDSAQGHLISPPLDAQAFWHWADSWKASNPYRASLLAAEPACA